MEIENKYDPEQDPRFLHMDFQGWPIFKRNLQEILALLGAEVKDGMIGFKTEDPILSIYPETIDDDGMGYGVDLMYISGANTSEDCEGNQHLYLWRDKVCEPTDGKTK